MKKLLLLLLSILILSPAYSDDSWNDFADLDRAWDNQKTITNQEFEQVMDTLETNKNKKEEKTKKKRIKKISGGGTSLHNNLDPNQEIKSQIPLAKKEEGLLLNIPVNIIIDEEPLEKGFYKVYAEKDKNNDIYLSFYQSQFFKGKVRASETTNDYGKETIDFVELLPYDEHFVKIIFGSLDYNAYAYVRFEENN